MSALTVNLTPPDYPYAPVSGVRDAEAFSVGASEVVHKPHHYPDANKVVAVCGVYGFGVERDSRLAWWRDAYPDCPRCIGLG